MDSESQLTRDRSIRLFTYLRELTQLRAKVVTDLNEYEQTIWLSEIPLEKECFCIARTPSEDSNSEVWIEIKKPKRRSHPELPEALQDWVRVKELRDSSKHPTLRDTITITIPADPNGTGEDQTVIKRLEESPEIVSQWETYLHSMWKPWAQDDQRLAKIENIYRDFFSIYQKQQKLGEAYEVILGLGFLAKKTGAGSSIRRHLLTTKVSLSFDSRKAVIVVGPPAEGTKLVLEQEMVDPKDWPSPQEVASIEAQAKETGEELWDRVRISNILKSWIHSVSPDGKYEDTLDPQPKVIETPVVHFAPAIILRKQNERSLLKLFQDIIEQLSNGKEIPLGVERLVHIIDDKSGHQVGGDGERPIDPVPIPPQEEIFFPLPSNREQQAIAERLASRQGVLVQGPPGTGKSHTIANLICHLLATGQRVLVTSHTVRALKVLQDKLPREVSALCVSLLGEDLNGLKALEDSVQGITEKYNSWDSYSNKERILELKNQLAKVRKERAELNLRARTIRESETYKHPLMFNKYSGTLASIAKTLSKESNSFAWFSDQPDVDLECPLSNEEGRELALLIQHFSALDEAELRKSIPPLDKLHSHTEFSKMVEVERLADNKFGAAEKLRAYKHYQQIRDLPQQARTKLFTELSSILALHVTASKFPYGWVSKCLSQVLSDRDRAWREVLVSTESHTSELTNKPRVDLEAHITGIDTRDPLETKARTEALLTHLESGGGLGFGPFKSKAVKDAEHIIATVRVDGKRCDTADAVRRLVSFLDGVVRLNLLKGHWAHHGEVPSGPPMVQVAEYQDFCEPIQKALEIHQKIGQLRSAIPNIPEPTWNDPSDIAQYLDALTAVVAEKEAHFTRAELESYSKVLHDANHKGSHPLVAVLIRTVAERDIKSYAEVLEGLAHAAEEQKKLSHRDKFLKLLAPSAPTLGRRLATKPLDSACISGLNTIADAWNWSRASRWVATQTDPKTLERLALSQDAARKREQELLRDLAAEKAWSHCFSRMTEVERQHLIAWSKAVKKIGKGTGKHANKHRKDARESMEKCRSAIPAWIMPLYRVAESVRPGTDVFDVAIVDEASQSGPEALFLNYLAKKVVVVGDDKQISPESWLQRESIDILREKFIHDLPHHDHIGVDDSFFDLAQIRFSGRIRLREHFRCMPEIIQFSNNLCYQSEPLVPLKQYGASRLNPVLKTVHVVGGFQEGSSGKIWNPGEVEALVTQIVQLDEDPLYKGKKFGVISLVGELQARQIEKRLLETLGPEKIEERELVCGDAYAFQGDERDVIFLTMVSAPSERHSVGVLNKAKDERRFNVAASRAKEQMWLFHTASLNDLNPNCLRYKILVYFLNPSIQRLEIEGIKIDQLRTLARSADRAVSSSPTPFDSWFEVDVFFKIHDRGYRVVPQYSIAGRRIDLLVEGMNGRLAVECDGDHWHGPDKWEEDIARQRDLERCGLQFWRVTESTYYLDEDAALNSLWETLKEKGIHPAGAEPAFQGQPTRKGLEELQGGPKNIPGPAVEPGAVEEEPSDDVEDIEVGPAVNADPDFPDPRTATPAEVTEALMRIISEEGPLPCHRAYRIYVQKAGIQRIGRQILSIFNKAIYRAVSSKKLDQENEFGTRDQVNRIVRLAGTPKVRVRPKGDRKLEEIPPSELAEVMKQLRTQSTTELPKGTLYKGVLQHYGFDRMTSNAQKVLDIASALSDVAIVQEPVTQGD